MKRLTSWRNSSRKTAILFLGIAAFSVIVLVWMGLRLVRQDRALEAQRLEDKREAAADRIAAALEKILQEEERTLADPQESDFVPAGKDRILVFADPAVIRVRPKNALLYYPVMPPGKEASPLLFTEAERAEFQEQNYPRAVNVLRSLAGSKDAAVRVGARLRMARNLRKAGQPAEALKIYQQLAGDPDSEVTVSGVASDLVARRARCVLLEEMARGEELRQEALNLHADLTNGRWRLDRASYVYYSEEAEGWVGGKLEPEAAKRALAEAVGWLWQNLEANVRSAESSSGRRSLRFDRTSVAVLWRITGGGMMAIVAGPEFQKGRWFEPIIEDPGFAGVHVAIHDAEGGLVYGNEPQPETPPSSRPSFATGLPWDISVVNADLAADRSEFIQRRRLMMAGLGMLALLVIAASALIGRAVSRELAAARLQSDFVSAVSHEFRTPLTSMRQFTEMLVEDEDLPAEKRHAFYRAQERATRRLSRLVESLLDFGRMEAGARPYRLQELDAGSLVRTVVEEFRLETDSNDVAIECSVPANGPLVNGDREALAQALWNLLDNAVRYSGDRADVRVEVEGGNPVVIRVRDRGVGIPPSERERIFLKFVRGSGAKVHGVKGTGIGLAMVKHIVDAHGGKVIVESELGQGSTFTIRLPAGG